MEIEVCDIDSRADWLAKYDTRVPLVEYGDRVISEYVLDHAAIAELVAALPQKSAE